MQTLQPLKTLIVYQDQKEIEALFSLTQKLPSLFLTPEICRSTFDLLNLLNSDFFDLTFFDETAFPYTIIDRFRTQLGIVAFKNKETISWKLSLETNRNDYLQLNSLSHESERKFLQSLKSETIVRYTENPQTHQQRGPKLIFKDGDKRISLYQDEVVYIEINGKLSTIHYETEGKQGSIDQWNGLTEFENLLNPILFFRTHRKHLVNLRYFKSICYKTKMLSLTKKENDKDISLEISFRQLRELKKVLKNYQLNKNVRLRAD